MGRHEQRPDPAAPPSEPEGLAPDYNEAGQPGFDYVRDRIEARFATSVGATELAGETPQAQSVDKQLEEREKVAEEKLDKIRAALREADEES